MKKLFLLLLLLPAVSKAEEPLVRIITGSRTECAAGIVARRLSKLFPAETFEVWVRERGDKRSMWRDGIPTIFMKRSQKRPVIRRGKFAWVEWTDAEGSTVERVAKVVRRLVR